MKKVVKFGGSSLANAEQFKKVGSIIMEDEARRYVVPSAPGKRHSSDTKVTDMLYACYEAAVNGEDFAEQLDQIKERYQEIIDGLGLTFSLLTDWASLFHWMMILRRSGKISAIKPVKTMPLQEANI